MTQTKRLTHTYTHTHTYGRATVLSSTVVLPYKEFLFHDTDKMSEKSKVSHWSHQNEAEHRIFGVPSFWIQIKDFLSSRPVAKTRGPSLFDYFTHSSVCDGYIHLPGALK